MNAIDFLIKEHNKVKAMFADINESPHRDDTKKKLLNNLFDELLRHETMEHKLWYPHFKNDKSLNDTIKHLLQEENASEKLISQFSKVKSQDEWEEKLAKLEQDVIHHAADEEHNLFPEVKKILTESQLNEIGKEMMQFKKDYPAFVAKI